MDLGKQNFLFFAIFFPFHLCKHCNVFLNASIMSHKQLGPPGHDIMAWFPMKGYQKYKFQKGLLCLWEQVLEQLRIFSADLAVLLRCRHGKQTEAYSLAELSRQIA